MSAVQFLRRHGMLADQIDEKKELSLFLAEMTRVSAGGSGSLKMIPAFLGNYHPPETKQQLIVIDIGGTNVRASIVEMGPDGLCGIRRFTPFLTPGLGEEMTADEFFRRIADGVSAQPLWAQAASGEGSRLGICFSFALKPLEGRDAKVAYGAKQIHVPDLVGQRIGLCFRSALQRLGRNCPERITVINDASAAALGGYSLPVKKEYDGYLGFIYGTGTNLSYCTKSGETINVESGAYCSFPAGDIDDAYDRSLIDAGQDRFEKMVSGGYLKGLVEYALGYAAQEHELSMSFPRDLKITPEEISAFQEDPLSGGVIANACQCPEDRQFLLGLFEGLTTRSAKLCSITITAALIAAEAGNSKEKPAFITAEGSTFARQYGFRDKLFSQMDSLAGRQHGLHYEFHTVPDVVLRGTAVACLSE